MPTPKLILAPMAGFTDAPFRALAGRLGADLCVTEMVSSVATVHRDEKTGLLAAISQEEVPCAIQIFGHDPKIMAEAAKILCLSQCPGQENAPRPYALDINMGCPVKKIAGNGDGSALMADPVLCGEIVFAVNEALSPYGIPVTVKMRAGLDSKSINAPAVARKCVEGGASVVTVHARTREELYTPGIRPQVIREVKEAVGNDATVIGNGDIGSAHDAIEMLETTGCDGLMIGRAALGNPWIFGEIKAKLENRSYTPPTLCERIDTAKELVKSIVAEKGEYTGIHEARGRAAHFIRGLKGAAAARDRLNKAETLSEFCDIIDRLKEE